ncbi:MAG: group II intron reverse transcriptase/maturase, partial [Oscillospiraceae bacterium]|nr:group II intron reverse transcriptase/maturase [Oscillospiraceae bacterium]
MGMTNSSTELIRQVKSRENLLKALRNIRFNKGSKTPGTDGKKLREYVRMETEEFVTTMTEALEDFHPHSLRRKEVPKENGKMRPIGIPTMKDRIIQQAIRQVIEPICEAQFSSDSYGFRPKRSAENAVAALSAHINLKRYYHIVDLDIEGFFDNVVHHTLLRQLWRIGIKDGEVIELIARMLKADIVMPDGQKVKPERGTPQGGIISPLLANVVLNDLDEWVNSKWRNRRTRKKYSRSGPKYEALRKSTKRLNLRSWHIVRYADDVKIVCETKAAAERAYEAVVNYLQKRLGLKVNPDKS